MAQEYVILIGLGLLALVTLVNFNGEGNGD